MKVLSLSNDGNKQLKQAQRELWSFSIDTNQVEPTDLQHSGDNFRNILSWALKNPEEAQVSYT